MLPLVSTPAPPLPALRQAQTPRFVRRLSRVVLAAIVLLPFVLVFVPWQQTAHGTGRATAFNPIYRTQFVTAQIDGKVKEWFVREGRRVRAGDPIVEMIDPDPQLEQRLREQMLFALAGRQAAKNRVDAVGNAILNIQASFVIQKELQQTLLRIEQDNLVRAGFDVAAAVGTEKAAELRYLRAKNLKGEAVSIQELEAAEQAQTVAKAQKQAAETAVQLRTKAVEAAQKVVDRIDKDQESAIARETALKESATAELAAADQRVVLLETQIARQRAQYVYSPCDGIVFRLLENAEGGGIFVRAGTRLAMIVPDIKSGIEMGGLLAPLAAAGGAAAGVHQAQLTGEKVPGIVAELFIDGNDLPLVKKGDAVRLQFEGWPAVQFVAFPDAAEGTFEGRVYLVDPVAANERGQFRILVEPDPDARPWPEEDLLRQGVRAQGWALMPARVTLGWEAWRLLNGFPITRPVDSKLSGSRLLGPVAK